MKNIKSLFIQKIKKLFNINTNTDLSHKVLLGKNLSELNNQKTPTKIEDKRLKELHLSFRAPKAIKS